METGTLETIRRIHCPYCDHSEDEDEVGQYQNFDLNHCNDPGTEQIWRCLKCGKLFKIYLE